MPQQGALRLATELGRLDVEPQEIAVVPRGVRFRVELLDGAARGYVCENYGAPFRLPDLGRDRHQRPRQSARLPHAARRGTRIAKATSSWSRSSMGNLWTRARSAIRRSTSSHGTATTRRTNTICARFNAIGSISFDHPDPSIFLVLQSPSDTPGVDAIDFVIFPPRILAMEHTFRPPWFHRNVASEFMGLIHGVYDAKAEGFVPGGASLHNCMSGHGPDAETFEKASRRRPVAAARASTDTMAFMFETRTVIRPTRFALEIGAAAAEYYRCWQGLQKHFRLRRDRMPRMTRLVAIALLGFVGSPAPAWATGHPAGCRAARRSRPRGRIPSTPSRRWRRSSSSAS